MQSFFHPAGHIPGIRAETLGHIGQWPVSNTTTFLWLITILFIIFYFAIRRFSLVPSFFQSLVELLYESVENLLNSLTSNRTHRTKELLVPILALFVIVGSLNIIGSFPILPEFTWTEGSEIIPLFRKATADINVTLPLALAIVITMQFFGVKNWGFFGYFKRFVPVHSLYHGVKKGPGAFSLALIEFFVGLLELVSEFVKVISLSLRLFGNMFAGEILLVILTSIFAVGLPAVWIGFDFLVAIIQTIVIGCLTAVYYTLVVREEGQEGH